MSIDNEESGLIPSQAEVKSFQPPDVLETQRQILAEVERLLKDPTAQELTYPSDFLTQMPTPEERDKLDYQTGDKIRFIMLKQPKLGGRDETCVAVLQNGARRMHTFGFPFAQIEKGTYSSKELCVTRLVQSAQDRLRRTANYIRINLSENIKDASGTLSIKGRNPSELSHHWDQGFAPLAPIGMFTSAGSHESLQPQDYTDLLTVLRTAKVDSPLTQKVAKIQEDYYVAKATQNTPTLIDSPQEKSDL